MLLLGHTTLCSTQQKRSYSAKARRPRPIKERSKKVLSNAIEQHFTKFRDRPNYYIDLPSLKRYFHEFTKNLTSAATIQDLIISIDHAFSIETDCLGSKDCNICKQVWTIRDKLAQKLRKALNIPNDVPVAHL